ncbi:MAG: SGNH/GDSL hydrolase family protein [Geminicoccaceae bacterium]
MRKVVRLIVINVVIVGFLMFLVNVGALIGLAIYDSIRPIQHADAHRLPNYADTDWAEAHFAEYAEIESSYEAFYGWRYQPFQGRTVNIDDEGRRISVQHETAGPERSVAFFGGSTMWGVGADDGGTIPSLFGNLNPDREVVNFGAIGFNAHQELNLMIMKLAEGYRPEAVIFYDGVNDALQKCHVDNDDAYGHAQETRIRSLLKENQRWSDPPLHFALMPTMRLFEEARKVLFKSSDSAPSYDCDQQPEKAEAVARQMLIDWRIARDQAEQHGARFLAVLQPTAYASKSKLDHVELDPVWGKQYETVYPIIVGLLDGEFSDLKEDFLDLRAALDQDDYLFIDWCHLSPNGNEIIAGRIDQALRRPGGEV